MPDSPIRLQCGNFGVRPVGVFVEWPGSISVSGTGSSLVVSVGYVGKEEKNDFPFFPSNPLPVSAQSSS